MISTRVNDYSVEARNMEANTYSLSGGALSTEIAGAVANLHARLHDLGEWTTSLPPRPSVVWNGKLYGPKGWRNKVRTSLTRHFAKDRSPDFTAGVIASSDRLIKDPEVLFPWIQTARNILAVDMESGGVYRACRDRVPMLAIRGISDIVGLKRDPAWTAFACKSAASFARAFLRTTPLRLPLNPPPPTGMRTPLMSTATVRHVSTKKGT